MGKPSWRSGGSVVGWSSTSDSSDSEALDVAADRDPELDRPGARHLVHPVGEVVVQDQGRRFGVVDDALDLGAREGRIQGDGLESALVRRQLPAQHVDVVGQGIGEDVAGTEALCPQSVDEAVGPSGQLRKGEGDPGGTGRRRPADLDTLRPATRIRAADPKGASSRIEYTNNGDDLLPPGTTYRRGAPLPAADCWVFDVDGCLVDSLTGTSLRPGARELLDSPGRPRPGPPVERRRGQLRPGPGRAVPGGPPRQRLLLEGGARRRRLAT